MGGKITIDVLDRGRNTIDVLDKVDAAISFLNSNIVDNLIFLCIIIVCFSHVVQ
jgi:hypothetical protein